MRGEHTEDWSTRAKRLTWAVEQSEMSQSDVARAIIEERGGKMTSRRPQMTKWMDGTTDLGVANGLLLATILDVDARWLLSGEGEPYQHRRMQVVRRATDASLAELRAMLAATPSDESDETPEEVGARAQESAEARERAREKAEEKKRREETQNGQ